MNDDKWESMIKELCSNNDSSDIIRYVEMSNSWSFHWWLKGINGGRDVYKGVLEDE